MTSPLYKLAELSRDHLKKVPYSCVGDSDLAECFINDLDLILDDWLPEQISTEQPVSALKYAPIVLGQTVSNELSGLYNASRDAFGQVRWTEFYEENEWNKSFLPAFAAGEGIGPDGRLQHDGFILGLFILGPDTYYPEHAHPAEEFYIILTGSPEFRKGEGEFSVQENGAVVMHHTEVSHAIRTSSEPFYGIYGWRGEITAQSWYRHNMNDASEQKKFLAISKS